MLNDSVTVKVHPAFELNNNDNNNDRNKNMNDKALVKSKGTALEQMSERLGMTPDNLKRTLRDTCFKDASDTEFGALVVVANEHELNPMKRQIFAFPNKRGGIVPVVSVDGWFAIVNRQRRFNGVKFTYEWQKKKNESDKSIAAAITCVMKVKDRDDPCEVTEYYDECYRNTDPWNGMPKRMLRHKAFMQCARVAFGLSGIYDEDEARDIVGDQVTSTSIPAAEIMPGIETDDVDTSPQPSPHKETPKQKPKVAKSKPKPEPPKKEENEAVDAEVVEEEVDEERQAEDKAEELESGSPLKVLVGLLRENNFSDQQFLEWAHMTGIADDDIDDITDISDKRLLSVINNWSKVEGQIDSLAKGGANE